MYREHFGLKELPFSIAPNPRYLYLTHQHQEALAHLIYGLNSAGGVILLTGEVGTGKTTISRKLLEDLPDNIVIAWIVNPRLSVEELLAAICDELSISYPKGNRSIKIFTDLINDCLIFAHGLGHNVVLMIDEAQNLSPEVLEQLRLLTNLETSERKLLQIILLGQPELKIMLERSDLRQLAQRITARYHLRPLSRQETCSYIRHRLAVGGCSRPVFTPRAMKLIHRMSHGTPRLINLLCDRAMLGAYSANIAMVHPKHVRQASAEVLGEADIPKRSVMIPASLALLLIATVMFATGAWKQLANNALHPPLKQAAVALPSPALAAADHHVIITGNAKETETLQYPMSEPIKETALKPEMSSPPEPAKAAAPKAELRQAPEPELTEGANLETPPVQPPEVPLSDNQDVINQDVVETRPSNETPVEAPKNDIADSPTATEKDKPITKTLVTPWNHLETGGSKILAFQTLAEIWHSHIDSTKEAPCRQLSDPKLSCMQRHANIWLLRQMNRPALFQTTGEDGLSHYAVIRFISRGHAVIQLGVQQWRVELSELKQHMQDQMDVIWFKPPGYRKDIQQGDYGETVQWLARQLDRIQGTMIPPRPVHSMDNILVERLKDFQQSEGMTPDGIAGILTLMRINERIGLDIPRLQETAR